MPISVRLMASADGNLAGIQLGERSLASFTELRSEVPAMIPTRGPDGVASEMEVELAKSRRFNGCRRRVAREFVRRGLCAERIRIRSRCQS